jgi:hypothetical protein
VAASLDMQRDLMLCNVGILHLHWTSTPNARSESTAYLIAAAIVRLTAWISCSSSGNEASLLLSDDDMSVNKLPGSLSRHSGERPGSA